MQKKKIREREERFRAIVNTANYDAIISTDFIGDIVFLELWSGGFYLAIKQEKFLLKNIDVYNAEKI